MDLDRKLQRQIVQLLVPLVGDQDQQTALILGAFFGSAILDRIQIGTAPRDFAIHLVTACVRYGALEDGDDAVIALLDEIESRVGASQRQQIQQIRTTLQPPPVKQVVEVPKVRSPLTTTTTIEINTPTLMRYFYEAFTSQDWERAQQLVDYLLQRPDLPTYFDANSYQKQIQAQRQQATENQAANNDYAILRVMAAHEDPAVVWDALLDFWDEHPDYDPDNLKEIGRDVEYQRLRAYLPQVTNARAWEMLTHFWDVFPNYDPDNLAVMIQRGADSYTEAMRRIEEAHYTNDHTLDLSGLDLHTVPPQIGYLHQLEKLNLANNNLRYLPHEMCQLTALRKLTISNNQLATLPPQIGNLSQLEFLQANQNQLQALPSSIQSMSKLTRLHLQHNQLLTLPPQVSGLKSLEVLDLGNNQIADLPHTMPRLKRLMWLFLNGNNLRAIPAIVYQIPDLQWLFLHDNQLETVDEAVINLKYLRWFTLSYNRIQHLPAAIGKLTKLEHIAVARGNPLRQVPKQVRAQRDGSILRWLRLQAQEEVAKAAPKKAYR